MKDYTETVRVRFNPAEISYRELLEVFWSSHDPKSDVFSRQYRNAVFFVDEEQRRQAVASRDAVHARSGRAVYTDIEEAGDFYPAEDYHQKYYLRSNDRLLAEFKAMYPAAEEFAASAAAARVNGYLGCNGDPDMLIKEIDRLGLSPDTRNYLVEYVGTKCRRFEGITCPAPR